MITWGSVRTGRVLIAVVVLTAALSTGQSAFGQTHGVSIGKSCQPNRCVGDTTDCLIEIGHDDDFGDSIEIREAWDVIDPKGGAVRNPPVGNLPIVNVDGNTTCTVGGSLPCLVCEGGVSCGGLPPISNEPGVVTFQSDEYVVQADDPNPLEDQANIRVQDQCDAPGTSGCSSIVNRLQFTAASTLLICNDNNTCTTDVCAKSVCSFIPDCDSPADCNDGNVCTSDICSAQGCCENPPLCTTAANCNDNNVCTSDVCLPSGCCQNTPLCTSNGQCNDNNACTTDTCVGGCCQNTPLCTSNGQCNDNNACTTDTCVGGCCQNTPLCTSNGQCNDNNACTTDTCVGGCCQNTPLCTNNGQCNDFNSCTTDTCVGGCCQNTPLCTNNGQCNDNNACTTDVCSGGCCVSTPLCTTNAQCNDNNACTNDVCVGGCCQSTPRCGPGEDCCLDGVPCNDGDACTTDFCPASGCCDAAPLCPPGVTCCAGGVSCDDGNACTTDTCVNGCCTHVPLCTSNAQCNDSNICTTDVCVGGCCQNTPDCTTAADCDDHNLCTTDACVTGCCNNTPVDCGEDPDPCTFLQCNASNGLCEARTINCEDGDPCTEDSCDSTTARCIHERSPCCGVECPPVVKAKFDIWDENERGYSGTERCISSWDQTLLSVYIPRPNHFLRQFLQTDKGKARIDGMASTVCNEPGENTSMDAPLLGLAIRELVFNNQDRTHAASELVGMGHQVGAIAYDLGSSPPPSSVTDGRPGRAARSTGKIGSPSATPTRNELIPVYAGGTSQPPAAAIIGRSSATQKGSLLVFTKIEIKWDAAGNLIQDTFLELDNDYPDPVSVRGYIVHGDVCNWVDTSIDLTMNQSTYWSALTGLPAGIQAMTTLGEGCPDDDPSNPGGRRLRGYFLAWAVDNNGVEISWNHLSGGGTVVNYRDSSAWEYGAWAFQALADVAHGSQLLLPHGILMLDNNEYQTAPDQLLMEFWASGASLENGSVSVGVDTDLTLWAVYKDLRQDPAPIDFPK